VMQKMHLPPSRESKGPDRRRLLLGNSEDHR
jgi:hypothetical protein